MVDAAAAAEASGRGLADATAVAGASTRSETVAVAAAAVWSAPTTSLYGEPQADAAVAVEASGAAVGVLALGGGLEEKYEGKKQICLECCLDPPPQGLLPGWCPWAPPQWLALIG